MVAIFTFFAMRYACPPKPLRRRALLVRRSLGLGGCFLSVTRHGHGHVMNELDEVSKIAI
jgi:hypothetical protein